MTQQRFEVGDSVSRYINGDYDPFTVIESRGKRIVIQADNVECVKPASAIGADDAEYHITPNSTGHTETWSLRSNGRYKKIGDSMNSGLGLTDGCYYRRNPHV